jgi:hypothetical protein
VLQYQKAVQLIRCAACLMASVWGYSPSRCHMVETSPAWFMVFLQRLLKGRSVSTE